MLGDTNSDFKRKLLRKTEEKVRGYRSVALNHYCGNGYAFCVMISRKLGLEYGDALTGGPAWDTICDRDRIDMVWVKPDRGLAKRMSEEAVRELTRIRAMTYGFHRQGQSAEFPEKRKIALRPLDVSPYLPSLVSRTGSEEPDWTVLYRDSVSVLFGRKPTHGFGHTRSSRINRWSRISACAFRERESARQRESAKQNLDVRATLAVLSSPQIAYPAQIW